MRKEVKMEEVVVRKKGRGAAQEVKKWGQSSFD